MERGQSSNIFDQIDEIKNLLDELAVDLEDKGENASAIIGDAHDLMEKVTAKILWEPRPAFRMRKPPV